MGEETTYGLSWGVAWRAYQKHALCVEVVRNMCMWVGVYGGMWRGYVRAGVVCAGAGGCEASGEWVWVWVCLGPAFVGSGRLESDRRRRPRSSFLVLVLVLVLDRFRSRPADYALPRMSSISALSASYFSL